MVAVGSWALLLQGLSPPLQTAPTSDPGEGGLPQRQSHCPLTVWGTQCFWELAINSLNKVVLLLIAQLLALLCYPPLCFPLLSKEYQYVLSMQHT